MAGAARSQLAGAWELERWEILDAGRARSSLPFGAAARGLLLYTPDGFMSASIMAAERPRFRGSPRSATTTARAAAFNGYFSYAGRYQLARNEVRHEVTIALNPSLVGTLQIRQVRLAGQALELSAEETLPNGRQRRHLLRWRRAPRGRAKPIRTGG